MRGLRRVSIAGVVIATVLTGGAALAGSGPSERRAADRPSGPSPFALPQGDAQDGERSKRLRLFGLQEPDETSFITVDGRVFTDEPVPLQLPGTALLAADLNGQNEVDEAGAPGAGDPDGSGTAAVQLTLDPPEVCATITVTGIELPATAAHIHVGAAGVNGPVVVPLPTPGDDGIAEGCVTEGLTTELVSQIAADPAGYYVNVHNATYPAGAVRGQLVEDPAAVIPSPGDRAVYRERLFALDDSDPDNPEPAGEQLGTLVAECTATTTGEVPEDYSWICSRMFTLDGRGDIAVMESYTFADPLADSLAITGGTGEFRDAGGQIDFEPELIEGEEFFNSVYDVRLLHLK
jgi:CHRD domain